MNMLYYLLFLGFIYIHNKTKQDIEKIWLIEHNVNRVFSLWAILKVIINNSFLNNRDNKEQHLAKKKLLRD